MENLSLLRGTGFGEFRLLILGASLPDGEASRGMIRFGGLRECLRRKFLFIGERDLLRLACAGIGELRFRKGDLETDRLWWGFTGDLVRRFSGVRDTLRRQKLGERFGDPFSYRGGGDHRPGDDFRCNGGLFGEKPLLRRIKMSLFCETKAALRGDSCPIFGCGKSKVTGYVLWFSLGSIPPSTLSGATL